MQHKLGMLRFELNRKLEAYRNATLEGSTMRATKRTDPGRWFFRAPEGTCRSGKVGPRSRRRGAKVVHLRAAVAAIAPLGSMTADNARTTVQATSRPRTYTPLRCVGVQPQDCGSSPADRLRLAPLVHGSPPGEEPIVWWLLTTIADRSGVGPAPCAVGRPWCGPILCRPLWQPP